MLFYNFDLMNTYFSQYCRIKDALNVLLIIKSQRDKYGDGVTRGISENQFLAHIWYDNNKQKAIQCK